MPTKTYGAKLPIGYAPEFRGHSRSTTRTPTNIFGGTASAKKHWGVADRREGRGAAGPNM